MATVSPTGPAGDAAAGELDQAELGRRLLNLNERANRGDETALSELEDLLDRPQRVWQTYVTLVEDTAAGWAKLLGHGQAVEAACLRQQLKAGTDDLAGADAPPLVLAAVGAA